jgi:hypothetical protein
MQTKNVGLAGLRGWRGSVANAVASPVAKRSSFGEEQVRAAIGAVFLLLSIVYILGAVKDLATDNG